MHLIILSGGSGKRLWPLSNEVRSKQFLKLLKDADGNPVSMVQRVFGQIKKSGVWDSVNVVSGKAQQDLLELQIGREYNLVIEKERRDTFPAVALACSFLISELSADSDDVVCVIPVDSYVDDSYFNDLQELEVGIEQGYEYMLLGVRPTFPTEKYGYILPDISENIAVPLKGEKEARKVLRFIEKPNVEVAQEIINEGGLWNCGVFCFRIKNIKEHVSNNYGISEFSHENMNNHFSDLNRKSFDYEILEQAASVGVIPYDGMWMDLGTWQTVTSEMSNLSEGNVIVGDGCNNTHVVNDLGLPIVVMGIEDSVVVASNDGILVSKKDETYKLKDLANGIDKRPMYERKRWGKYRVIHEGDNVITKQLIIFKDQKLSYQYHLHRKEIWTVIKGEGELLLEDERRVVGAGDVIQIEKEQKHAIKAITDLEIIEVQMGENLIEDDIVRIDLDWR